jgi:hypothetical protein
MTQTARKGKLCQLQYQIDLSCLIVALHPCIGWSLLFTSTKLIHFVNSLHKASRPPAAARPHPPGGRGTVRRQWGEKRTIRSISLFCFYPLCPPTKRTPPNRKAASPHPPNGPFPQRTDPHPSPHFVNRGKSPSPSPDKLPSPVGEGWGGVPTG